MRAIILYYTGTNNTKYIVNQEVKKFTKYQINIDTYDLIREKDKIDNFDIYDLIIINYPIYAFNAPLQFEKALKKLKINNKKYLIIKNSGEPLKINDASSKDIIKIMRRKNNHFISEYHLLMPYYIMFSHDDNMVKQMLTYNDKYLDYIIHQLLETNYPLMKKHFAFSACVMNGLGKLERVGARINSRLKHVDKKKCLCCQKCLKECPFDNIVIKNNYPIFLNKCQLCMRCHVVCPVDAIKGGLFDKWKVTKEYDFEQIIANHTLDGDYLSKAPKTFKKVYYPYYNNLETKINQKK